MYANGDEYTGEWIASKKNGRGKYCYADGEVKEGLWRDDVFVSAIPTLAVTPEQSMFSSGFTSSGSPSLPRPQPLPATYSPGAGGIRRRHRASRNGPRPYPASPNVGSPFCPQPPSSSALMPPPPPNACSSSPPFQQPHQQAAVIPAACSQPIVQSITLAAKQGAGDAAPAFGSSDSPTVAAVEITEDKLCVICMDAVKDGIIAHGKTAHVCCCFACADKLKKARKGCPICRLTIDVVLRR